MNRKKISLSLGCIAALAGICLLTPSCGNNGCEETRESYLYTQLTATSGMTLNTLSPGASANKVAQVMCTIPSK